MDEGQRTASPTLDENRAEIARAATRSLDAVRCAQQRLDATLAG
jgi:hypothetical protein